MAFSSLHRPLPIYCPLSPLHPFSTLWPPRSTVLSMALFLLYGPLSPLQPSVPSVSLCPLSMSLCSLSMSLCPLSGPLNRGYSPMSPLWLLSPPRPSVPSAVLCPVNAVSSMYQGGSYPLTHIIQ
jgi:hypothetical protein